MATLPNAHTLVIGVSKYLSIPKLPPSVCDDASDVFSLLVDAQYCAYGGSVERLLDGDATAARICAGLQTLAGKAADRDATVFLYFSGHGTRVVGNGVTTDYLLPVDVEVTTPGVLKNAISAEQLARLLAAIPARRMISIFDCCHGGAFGATKDLDTAKSFEPIPDAAYTTLGLGTGRIFIAACRSSEVAWIEPGARNSLYTGHLLEGLRGAAGSHDQFIRVLDLISYIDGKVVATGRQQPVFHAGSEAHNFAIAFNHGGAPQPRPGAGPRSAGASSSSGFAELVTLVQEDEDIRATLTQFRSNFENVVTQIERIDAYKHVHDLLQQLETQYSLVPPMGPAPLDADAPQWMTMESLMPVIETSLDDLLAFAGPNAVISNGGLGLDRLSDIVVKTSVATKGRNSLEVAASARLMAIQVGTLGSKVNAKMVASAESIALAPLRAAFNDVLRRLSNASGTKRADRIREAIAAIGDIETSLKHKLWLHDKMQEMEQNARVVATFLTGTSDVSTEWEIVRSLTRQVLESGDSRWSTRLKQSFETVERGVTPVFVAEATRKALPVFRGALTNAFNHVDRDLLSLCVRLESEIAQPLQPLVNVLVG
jgi:hypothetical protein